jgi:hypothetical protein
MRHGQAMLHVEEVKGRGRITPDAAGASGGSLHEDSNQPSGPPPRLSEDDLSRVQTAHAASYGDPKRGAWTSGRAGRGNTGTSRTLAGAPSVLQKALVAVHAHMHDSLSPRPP